MYPIKANKLIVTSKFGPRTYTYQGKQISDYHKGIDLVASPNNRNEDIVAFADGVVTSVQKTGVQYGTGCYVRVKHSNGYYTLYYHLKSGSIVVNVGESVKKDQKLGIIGATGQATGVHLHFQIDKGSSATAIDPYDYIFNGKEFINNSTPTTDPFPNVSDEELAKRVWAGEFGNGDERKAKLGSRYASVQALVNKGVGKPSTPTPQPTPAPTPNVDILTLVKKTIRGDFGNGETRKNALGSNYTEVQRQVNLNIQHGTTRWDNIKLY